MRAFAVLCFLPVLSALAAPAGAPAFDVASVKPAAYNGPPRGGDVVKPGPASVSMTNIRFKALLQWAYHLQALQITGPGWMDSERFDIQAKASQAVPIDTLRQMMQTLLLERFHLTAHQETKEMPAYVFSIAKGGHKMKQSEGEGEMSTRPEGNGKNPTVMHFSHVSMANIIDTLSSPIPGVIVDQTGLTGAWDFTLDASSMMTSQPTGMDEAINGMVQMLTEQIGIKVDQKKVPVPVLVVERAEKVPVEN